MLGHRRLGGGQFPVSKKEKKRETNIPLINSKFTDLSLNPPAIYFLHLTFLEPSEKKKKKTLMHECQ